MQKKLKTTINFTPDEIKEILLDYVNGNLGLTVDHVSFDVRTETTGFGMNERDETVFTGASVTGTVDVQKTKEKVDRTYNSNSLAAQIAAAEKDNRPYGDR